MAASKVFSETATKKHSEVADPGADSVPKKVRVEVHHFWCNCGSGPLKDGSFWPWGNTGNLCRNIVRDIDLDKLDTTNFMPTLRSLISEHLENHRYEKANYRIRIIKMNWDNDEFNQPDDNPIKRSTLYHEDVLDTDPMDAEDPLDDGDCLETQYRKLREDMYLLEERKFKGIIQVYWTFSTCQVDPWGKSGEPDSIIW